MEVEILIVRTVMQAQFGKGGQLAADSSILRPDAGGDGAESPVAGADGPVGPV